MSFISPCSPSDTDEPAFPPTALQQRRTAGIRQDAEQPGAETILLPISAERSEGTEKGLLDDVFRVVLISQHPKCESPAFLVMPTDERTGGVAVASGRGGDELGISHVLYNNG